MVAEENAVRVVQAVLEDLARELERFAVLDGVLVGIVVVLVVSPYNTKPV